MERKTIGNSKQEFMLILHLSSDRLFKFEENQIENTVTKQVK